MVGCAELPPRNSAPALCPPVRTTAAAAQRWHKGVASPPLGFSPLEKKPYSFLQSPEELRVKLHCQAGFTVPNAVWLWDEETKSEKISHPFELCLTLLFGFLGFMVKEGGDRNRRYGQQGGAAGTNRPRARQSHGALRRRARRGALQSETGGEGGRKERKKQTKKTQIPPPSERPCAKTQQTAAACVRLSQKPLLYY